MKPIKLSKYMITAALCGSLLTSGTIANAAVFPWLKSNSSTQTNSNNSIWASMSQNFSINSYANNPRVQQQIAWLIKNQKSLYKSLQKAGPYLAYVYQQTQKRGLPAELALLPIVESGFNPTAQSQVGARGLWQLMPKTAVELGVKTTSSYDGRVDIIASTQAALSYLTRLSQSFDRDWYLALAAYNCGPGRVKNAVKKQMPWYKRSNYWALKLPQETQNYVPKLLALAAIVKNPEQYGVTLPPISSRTNLATITIAGNVDFKKITNASNVSMDTLKQLNPGHNKLATTSGAPNTLLVPAHAVAQIKPAVPLIAASSTDLHVANLSNVSNQDQSGSETTSSDGTTDGPNENISVPSDSTVNSNLYLIKTIFKESNWFLLTLANIPGSDRINTLMT